MSIDSDVNLVVKLAGCTIAKHPGVKDNWVSDVGKLPDYICRIARALIRDGHDSSEAVSIAVARCKVWAAGGSNVTAKTRALAAAAVSEWEELKAKADAKGGKNVKQAIKGDASSDAKKLVKASNTDGNEYVFLCVGSFNVDAVRAAFYALQQNRNSPYSSIVEMWSDYLIVQTSGPSASLVKIPFTVDPSTQKVSFGDPTNVISQYVPVDANGLPVPDPDDDPNASDTDVSQQVLSEVALSGPLGKIVKLSNSDNKNSPLDTVVMLAAKTFTTKDRKDLAAKGQAMKDGSFPIANTDDLKNAIKTYGLAKDKAAAKAWIIKRAKALNAVSLLPDGWVSDTVSASALDTVIGLTRKEAGIII